MMMNKDSGKPESKSQLIEVSFVELFEEFLILIIAFLFLAKLIFAGFVFFYYEPKLKEANVNQSFLKKVDKTELINTLIPNVSDSNPNPDLNIKNHIENENLISCVFDDCLSDWYQSFFNDDQELLDITYAYYLKSKAGKTELYDSDEDDLIEIEDKIDDVLQWLYKRRIEKMTKDEYYSAKENRKIFTFGKDDNLSQTYKEFVEKLEEFDREYVRNNFYFYELKNKFKEHESVTKRRDYIANNPNITDDEIKQKELEIELLKELVEELEH
ncbi:hypothetical protein [Vibrio parahaemolyticus]|uniref:hypothetical protein n=1 Tax=Vibrio parahaemolyticus TaxID=670 RepID=UPI0011AB850E|nr:hypothetical protein [Vibrio parahaemolyticus]